MNDFYRQSEHTDTAAWHEMGKFLRKSANKIAYKMYDQNDAFVKSVVVPTDMYPLNQEKFQVFSYNNTVQITDERILALIDEVPYQIGLCYQNTEAIVKKLIEAGIDVKPYCGWLFISKNQYPVHHCWAVLNGESVIDLVDDFTLMYAAIKAGSSDKANDTREVFTDFIANAKSLPNSSRCHPVGQPTPLLYYIGCECDPNEGRKIYQNLMKRYPNHECEQNCDRQGWNKTQKMLRERGLM